MIYNFFFRLYVSIDKSLKYNLLVHSIVCVCRFIILNWIESTNNMLIVYIFSRVLQFVCVCVFEWKKKYKNRVIHWSNMGIIFSCIYLYMYLLFAWLLLLFLLLCINSASNLNRHTFFLWWIFIYFFLVDLYLLNNHFFFNKRKV